MRREPKKAGSTIEAYYELTKPSITFMILISTALGYFIGGNGISDYGHFLITLLGILSYFSWIWSFESFCRIRN